MKSLDEDTWKLVLSANERKEFSGGASKASMRLTDSNFQDTGVFSLFFLPKMEDQGLYSCLIKQGGRKIKERIILLAVLTVTIVPEAPVPQNSILRLIADVTPKFAVTRVSWAAPGDVALRSEKMGNTGNTVAKLPQFRASDAGAYTCVVLPRGNSSNALFAFNVDVTMDGPQISTAALAQASFPLLCPGVQGDYVLLYWESPDSKKQKEKKLVYQYDRWRGTSELSKVGKQLRLAGPPYNHQTGSFSFLLTPGIKDGGLYTCQVFFNDNTACQSTLLSVLKVKASRSPSKLELSCQYSERSHVQYPVWTYRGRRLPSYSPGPGLYITTLPLPITSETAGNYTCALQLKNGQTAQAVHTVILPPKESNTATATPSLLPSLSALLLLVPLVAAAVGVLLWRQGHISRRGIEQSLSHYSGEAENIYENPEDIRQTSPQGSVYMDLNPRAEDDVYKELDRQEPCQG
ncbi:g6f-like [Polymixia lowei]